MIIMLMFYVVENNDNYVNVFIWWILEIIMLMFYVADYNDNVLCYMADTDECGSGNIECNIDQICMNTPGGAVCICKPGYVGAINAPCFGKIYKRDLFECDIQ